MEPNEGWIEKLAELRSGGRSCVMVVVTDVRGSTPRETGTRMIVADGELVWGTIGGGNLEHQAIERATALAATGSPGSETVEVPLAEKTGQCCGGQVTLFYESFQWSARSVCVFGAGHVGQALAALAPWMRARVTLIDGREESELIPTPPVERPYELVCLDAPEGEIDTIPTDALVVIMTHSHALDLEILAAALRRDTFPYVGLIGSDRKWQRFRQRLEQRGLSRERIDSVRCPIGVTRGSKDPTAIALSTATELVEVMDRMGQGRQASGRTA